MHYKIEDVQNLAQGVYPKRCIYGDYSETCIVEEGKTCGINGDKGKDNCFGWVGVNIFELPLLAQDFADIAAERDRYKAALERIAGYDFSAFAGIEGPVGLAKEALTPKGESI